MARVAFLKQGVGSVQPPCFVKKQDSSNSTRTPISVSSGFCNKVSETEQLQEQTCISHSSGH